MFSIPLQRLLNIRIFFSNPGRTTLSIFCNGAMQTPCGALVCSKINLYSVLKKKVSSLQVVAVQQAFGGMCLAVAGK